MYTSLIDFDLPCALSDSYGTSLTGDLYTLTCTLSGASVLQCYARISDVLQLTWLTGVYPVQGAQASQAAKISRLPKMHLI